MRRVDLMKEQINRTIDSKLYKVLKVKLNDNATYVDINMDDKYKLKKMYTLVKESEVTRIIRCLELDNNNKLDYGFVLIDDIISVEISTKIYKENKTGIITVNKSTEDEDGNIQIVSSIYKRLLASTGSIRSNKIILIKEELFDKANDILLCGMHNDMEFEFFSKLSAYYALANTDSTPVTMPRIVVVKDFEFNITEDFDIVTETVVDLPQTYTPKGKEQKIKTVLEYDVITDKHDQETKPFDGAGLVDIRFATKWAKELKLDYVPSSYQFRCIPGIKGNLYPVDLVKFAEGFPNKKSIVDAWGNNVDLYDVNGIFSVDVILTVSQFKFFKQYESFKEWKDYFDTELHGYKRTFNIAHVGDKLTDLKDKTLLSYQPLQSLKLDADQINALCQDTVNTIKNISINVDSFLRYRGVDNENDSQVPEYYKALEANKELFFDPWMQGKIQKDIEGFKKKTYRGSLFCPGNYQTAMPDIYGLALYAFGEIPVGLLKKDEVYSNYWVSKNVKSVGVVRFPHVANEWGVVDVVDPASDTKMDFYKYITTGIITSMYSTLPLKANSMDFDGDKIFTISGMLRDVAKDQLAKTITFVSDKPNANNKPFHRINEVDQLIATDIKGMSNNIGAVINKISILWSMEQTEQVQKYIKIMSIIGSLTIDYVKTGEKTPIPKEIMDFLKDETLPEFMRTRYKAKDKSERNDNKNRVSLGKEEVALFNQNVCTMNEICKHMHSQVDTIKLAKESPDFNFMTSMIDKEVYAYNETYPKIVSKLLEMKLESDEIARLKTVDDNGDCDTEKNTERDYMYKTFYEYCRIELLQLCTVANKMDKNKLIDCLIYAFFCDKKFALGNMDKAILWNCFGKDLTTRFKGKVRKTSSYSEEKIEKLSEKATELQATREKQKKGKTAKNKEHAKINSLVGTEEIRIYKSELIKIKDTMKNLEAEKLAIGLLVLDRFCKAYHQEFHIYNAKRNTINRTQICVLTGINVRRYDDLIKTLIENKIITLSPKSENNYSVLSCSVAFDKAEGVFIDITDINDVSKILKNIRKLGKVFNK